MSKESIARERLNGPLWAAFLSAADGLQEADGALFEGIADEDAEEIEQAVVRELARRGYLAHDREPR